MENKKTAAFGIYKSVAAADTATDTLVKAGFAASDVSILLPENLGARQIGTEKATKAPEGATAGAGTGAVLGGTLGFPGLASLTLGTLRFLKKVRISRAVMLPMSICSSGKKLTKTKHRTPS
jgi:hypothetical protein